MNLTHEWAVGKTDLRSFLTKTGINLGAGYMLFTLKSIVRQYAGAWTSTRLRRTAPQASFWGPETGIAVTLYLYPKK